MLHNRLTKNAAIKLVFEKSRLLKKAYKDEGKFLTIHKRIHKVAEFGTETSYETVRRVLNFSTNPIKSAIAPAVFRAFNQELEEHTIKPIDYLTILHHFPKR